MYTFKSFREALTCTLKNGREVFLNTLKYSGDVSRNAWKYAVSLFGNRGNSYAAPTGNMFKKAGAKRPSAGLPNFGRLGLRTALTALAIGVMIFSITGGTMAWLSAETPPLTNTFTYGDINITLTETDSDGDGSSYANTYVMMPGHKISKDPVVTVLKDSEACWLFVKLEKSDNFDDFMEFTVADGWLELEDQEGVYYRQVDKAEADINFEVLKNNEVKVKDSVTKAMLNKLDENGASNYPTLVIYSYAVQRDSDIEAIDSAAEAWALAIETENEAE